MAESPRADAGTAVRIRRDVEHDVVGTRDIARHAADTGEMVQAEQVPHAPRDVVVGARGVATDADAPDENLALGVEAETPAEHVDAANGCTTHRVLCRSLQVGWP